jgi:hypothetical protein
MIDIFGGISVEVWMRWVGDGFVGVICVLLHGCETSRNFKGKKLKGGNGK